MRLVPRLPRFTYLGLLISLTLFFVVAPFFSGGTYARGSLDLSILVILIFSVYLCSDNKRNVIISVILAFPALVRLVYPSLEVDEVTLSINVCFFAFVIYELLISIFKTYEVNQDVIYGAVSVYVLIGIFWGLVYTLLEFFLPGSFNLPNLQQGMDYFTAYGQDLIYYSFVTLCTLGYGDIVSVSTPAKYLSVLETMTGQIYLTVLVARLVGMHIAGTSRSQ